MQISGEWFPCDDGIRRPVIQGKVRSGAGEWMPTLFLVDTGADRSVFNAGTLESLALEPVLLPDSLEGLGGRIRSVSVETTVHLFHEQGREISFHGQFAAVTDPEALDMSILGRDILGLFAVIVDQPSDVVCLLSQRHTYAIVQR
jgi:hypothetical protein